jgi:hypothetical protein
MKIKLFVLLVAIGFIFGCSKDNDSPSTNNNNNNQNNNTVQYEFLSVASSNVRVYSQTNLSNDYKNYYNFTLPQGTEEVVYTINSSPVDQANGINLIGQVIKFANPVVGGLVQAIGNINNSGSGSTFSYYLYAGSVRKDDLGRRVLDGDGNTRFSVSDRTKSGFPMYAEFIKSDKKTFTVSTSEARDFGFYIVNESETNGMLANIEVVALVRKK